MRKILVVLALLVAISVTAQTRKDTLIFTDVDMVKMFEGFRHSTPQQSSTNLTVDQARDVRRFCDSMMYIIQLEFSKRQVKQDTVPAKVDPPVKKKIFK
jgi:hypothetical protein